MKRIVDEIVEIPLSVCGFIIEIYELDFFEFDFISPVDLAQELANEKKGITDSTIRALRNRFSEEDFEAADQISDNIEEKRELIKEKIKGNNELLTINLEFFLNKLVRTLSTKGLLSELIENSLIESFIVEVCEYFKNLPNSEHLWDKVTLLFFHLYGIKGRVICLSFYADKQKLEESAHYLPITGLQESKEIQEELPLNGRHWFTFNEAISRLEVLGIKSEQFRYMCSIGEIECCVDILSLDRPVRSFAINTAYKNKVSKLVKFERSLPSIRIDISSLDELGFSYTIQDSNTVLSRLLALEPLDVSKILYQGGCTQWEAGINGFEAIFGDNSPQYGGVEFSETIELAEKHLLITVREVRRLEKYLTQKNIQASSELLSETKENSYLATIGALLTLLTDGNGTKRYHNQDAVINAINELHGEKNFSRSKLTKLFPKANNAFKEKMKK